MGGNSDELDSYGKTDRSQVLPFSVMMFSEIEGWQQYGVYETREKANTSVEEVAAKYMCKTAIADTNKILDLAHPDNGDDPLWILPN